MFQRCARCGAPAASAMSYAYSERQIWLDDLVTQVEPGTGYALCTFHGDRLIPPVGWSLIDRREGRSLFVALSA